MKRQKKTLVSSLLRCLPDKTYLKLRYRIALKRKLNLKSPITYNEKIQWMKLYDRNPLYTDLVDKAKVKDLIEEKANKIGLKVIPTLCVWDDPEKIELSSLPESFVLKCTHDSGSVLLFKAKSDYTEEYVRKHFKQAMKRSQYAAGREWAYKNVKPRVIAEPFMVDESGCGLKDYKFFCFDGTVRALFVATDRGKENTEVKFDFFDEKFNHLPMKHGHPNSKVIPQKPKHFEEMIRIAEELSRDLRHVRVDLYDINGDIYFGEMTFYHHCGFVPFEPEEWDRKFGGWLRIEDSNE